MRTKKVLIYFFIFNFLKSHITLGNNNFPLKDGDIWVFVGNSITAQLLHTNYFEGFCVTRFSKLTLHFRNEGYPGDTALKVLNRFERDVVVWKPTVVSIELGMNDSGYGIDGLGNYIENMEKLIRKIKEIKALPIIFSSSPVNDGSTLKRLSGRNESIKIYTDALKKLTEEHQALFVDQFHPLVDIWGKNKYFEDIYKLEELIKVILLKPEISSRELLEKWIKNWRNSDLAKQGVDIQGDPIHPGPIGQLMMCVTLLKGLNAPGLVSELTIDCLKKEVKEVQCKIRNLKIEKGKISFDRIDECLPMPIPSNAYDALRIYPDINELNRWILKITNLQDGEYEIFIDGVKVGEVSGIDLKTGWNMGLLREGPVNEQCQKILLLIQTKERLVTECRNIRMSLEKNYNEEDKKKLEENINKILQLDNKIKENAQPIIHRFEIFLKK